MEWIIYMKREKYSDIFALVFGEILLFIILYVIINGDIIAFAISAIIVGALLAGIIFILYKKGEWDAHVVRLEKDTITINRLSPDGRTIEAIKPVKVSKIYKIVITKHALYMFHIGDDGVKYRTVLGLSGIAEGLTPLSKEDKRKRQEILHEILKRVDKNRVEVVDKRKKKRV